MGTELQGAELAACKILASKQASEKIDNRPQVAIHGRLEELHVGGDAAVQRLPESLRALNRTLPGRACTLHPPTSHPFRVQFNAGPG